MVYCSKSSFASFKSCTVCVMSGISFQVFVPYSQNIPFYCNTFLFHGCSISPYFSDKSNFSFFPPSLWIVCFLRISSFVLVSAYCVEPFRKCDSKSRLDEAGWLVSLGVVWLDGRPACHLVNLHPSPHKYQHVMVFSLEPVSPVGSSRLLWRTQMPSWGPHGSEGL